LTHPAPWYLLRLNG